MLASSISQLIESCGLCQAGEVKAIQTMKAGMTNRSCTCQEKVDTKKGKITGSPVRSCTELGFCSPRQQPDGDD